MALSATYSVTDVKDQLKGYAYYDYANEAALTTAVDRALAEAMNDFLIPIIGTSEYYTIRELDRDWFDDATCDTTDGDKTMTMDSTTNVSADMYVYGSGIPAGAQVDSVTDSTNLELTQAATETATNITCTFNALTEDQSNIYRSEVNYACYSFYDYWGRQDSYASGGTSDSRSQGGVNYSHSGLSGPHQAAASYLKRAKAQLAAANYSTMIAIKRGDSIHYSR